MTTATHPITAGTWAVDAAHSNLGFRARHFGLTWLRGGFTEFDASLTVQEDGALTLAGSAPVGSIDVGNEQLLGHLQSPDFFDAQLHPTLTFASSSIDLADDGTATVEGELTMKGVTHPVTLTGTWATLDQDPWGGTRVGFEIGGTIDRDAWGVSWNADLPNGAKFLGPKVRLEAELELVRQ